MVRSRISRMMREGTGGLLPAGEIPSSVVGTTETAKIAFCPMLFAATGSRGLCSDPDCYGCEYAPEGRGWLCSNCSKGEATLPYYTEGTCTKCGGRSIVLSIWKR